MSIRIPERELSVLADSDVVVQPRDLQRLLRRQGAYLRDGLGTTQDAEPGDNRARPGERKP